MANKESVDVSSLQRKEAIQKKTELDDDFVKDHMSMIEAMVANITGSGKVPPGLEFEDMVSWGVEGLIKAHKNFDPDKGSQFKTYAYYRIRGEIFDRIRKEWKYRNPNDYYEYRKRNQERIANLAEDAIDDIEKSGSDNADVKVNRVVTNSAVMCLMSLDNMEVASSGAGTKNPEIEFIDESQDELWEEIRKLDETEQHIVELFYVKEYKQKEIAEELDMSRSTVCRMHMKILKKLKDKLKDKYED